MAITQGHVGATGWSQAFRLFPLGATVFEVAPAQHGPVLEWAGRQPVAHAAQRAVHSPSAEAWAVLDGGLLHVYGYGLSTLPAGVYVVGLQAFRLVLGELGFPVPEGLAEASSIAPEELRRRHRTASATDPSGVEQAELLATCTDATMLRWVATTLLAEYGTTADGTGTR